MKSQTINSRLKLSLTTNLFLFASLKSVWIQKPISRSPCVLISVSRSAITDKWQKSRTSFCRFIHLARPSRPSFKKQVFKCEFRRSARVCVPSRSVSLARLLQVSFSWHRGKVLSILLWRWVLSAKLTVINLVEIPSQRFAPLNRHAVVAVEEPKLIKRVRGRERENYIIEFRSLIS